VDYEEFAAFVGDVRARSEQDGGEPCQPWTKPQRACTRQGVLWSLTDRLTLGGTTLLHELTGHAGRPLTF
jgi:hypothetical protein